MICLNCTVNSPKARNRGMIFKQGDYVLFDVTLKNNKKTAYKIKSVTDNNTKDNIKITYDYDKSIAPGKTGSLKIKMTYFAV